MKKFSRRGACEDAIAAVAEHFQVLKSSFQRIFRLLRGFGQ